MSNKIHRWKPYSQANCTEKFLYNDKLGRAPHNGADASAATQTTRAKPSEPSIRPELRRQRFSFKKIIQSIFGSKRKKTPESPAVSKARQDKANRLDVTFSDCFPGYEKPETPIRTQTPNEDLIQELKKEIESLGTPEKLKMMFGESFELNSFERETILGATEHLMTKKILQGESVSYQQIVLGFKGFAARRVGHPG